MTVTTNHGDNGQQNLSQVAKQKISLNERLAFSVSEFSNLFGRERSWGYRLLYQGRIQAIQNMGRLMIPRHEAERLIGEAKIYGDV